MEFASFGLLLCRLRCVWRTAASDGLEYKRQEADLLRMRRLTGGSKEDAGQAGAGMSGQNAGEEADWAAKDGATHWEDQTARLDRRRRSWEANPDTIGWISIPGTEIDYPVMYTPEDPDFYLNHGFDREPSAGGMIYLDAGDDCGGRKAQEPAEEEAAKRNNFILYGHHMKNGTMFAGLEQYLDRSFLRSTGPFSLIRWPGRESMRFLPFSV